MTLWEFLSQNPSPHAGDPKLLITTTAGGRQANIAVAASCANELVIREHSWESPMNPLSPGLVGNPADFLECECVPEEISTLMGV